VNPDVKPEEEHSRPDPGQGGAVPASRCKRPVIPDFELIRPIGRGAYGDVWLARGLTGVYRAIKIVWRERFADAEPFEREFKGLTKFTTMALPESGQLALLHVGQNEAEGFFYYVMELADDVDSGREVDPARYAPLTLKEVRDRRGRLPAEECVRFGAELASALAGLHSRGLVHRDIKPSNVIMVGGVPKLADVGLVASTDDARTFVGTEGYVPPEGPGKPSADVFSLGKMLYELATGLDREDYPRLPEELAKLPDRKALLELNEIILSACDPEDRKRYADASEMLGDLLELQAGHSIRVRRSRALATRIAAAAMLILAVAGAGYWWKNHLAAAPPPSEVRQLLARAWEQLNKAEPGAEGLGLADGFCKRAAELDPTEADAWAAWSQVDSFYVGFGIDDSAGRREAARTNASRALKLAPDSYEARLAQACYLIRAGPGTGDDEVPTYAQEADRLFRQLIKEKPDEVRAQRAFAVLQVTLGHVAEARDALTKLTRDPQLAAWAWVNLAALEAPSSLTDAEAAIDRSIAIQPSKGAIKWRMVLDLSWRGDLAAAKADVDRIPASMMLDDSLIWLVYRVYYLRREPDKALTYLQAIPRDWINGPSGSPISMLIGDAQLMAGRKDAARMEWRKALKQVEQRLADQPTDALQVDQKGMLLTRLGEYADAEKCMQLVAEMSGKECFDWGDLLSLKLAEGQPDAAMDIIENHFEPNISAVHLRLAPEFDALRGNPRFKAALARAESDPNRSSNSTKGAAIDSAGAKKD